MMLRATTQKLTAQNASLRHFQTPKGRDATPNGRGILEMNVPYRPKHQRGETRNPARVLNSGRVLTRCSAPPELAEPNTASLFWDVQLNGGFFFFYFI